ncbi:hypothetical protein [Halapricum hydrolyticum]|uniref:Uncharacterized protein n=1 Tax=Halapricum hydrolyticum TaxID=2979991 RepID=A0AAE3LG57_9EURY|nr:hypothetical protein [Halapricum hydrolyticum]MCU4719391.1 hypothetical protein [Halapricum hydrolyticum]MCU4728400.1 hypothetical protein [Halapricum hydrolyticum]
MADALARSELFSIRRFARFGYIGLFVLVAYFTPLFEQYPLLQWLGIAGLVIVFFDAIICARRRWRVLREEMRSDEAEPN